MPNLRTVKVNLRTVKTDGRAVAMGYGGAMGMLNSEGGKAGPNGAAPGLKKMADPPMPSESPLSKRRDPLPSSESCMSILST